MKEEEDLNVNKLWRRRRKKWKNWWRTIWKIKEVKASNSGKPTRVQVEERRQGESGGKRSVFGVNEIQSAKERKNWKKKFGIDEVTWANVSSALTVRIKNWYPKTRLLSLSFFLSPQTPVVWESANTFF